MQRTWDFILRELVGTSAKWTRHGLSACVCSKSRIHNIQCLVSVRGTLGIGQQTCEAVKNKDVAEHCSLSLSHFQVERWFFLFKRKYISIRWPVSSSCHRDSSLNDQRETEHHLDVDRWWFHVSRGFSGHFVGELC